MTPALLVQPTFNQDDLAHEWEEAYQNKARSSPTVPNNSQFSHYNAIFSDDEDDQPQQPSRWLQNSLTETILSSTNTPGYIDPVLSSSTYHIHQADNALQTLKHIVQEDGWKKALKHKSGVIVHMKNGIHKGDKTPIFKGEAIIQGFSPQAIFYVIGMRKLWDEQYEDGNLVENLNDTTSLTYEIMKPTATSKSRDLALVEKIECTQNGAIVFACTSVETPRIPRMSGRTRVNTKLQGWVLEPLHGSPVPATKVVFVVQESMKGWVPGFAKKTLARRPLVIAKVAEYLEKKTERMRLQQQVHRNNSGLLQSINSGYSRRPSVMSNHVPPQQQTLRHFNSSNKLMTPSATSIKRSSPELVTQQSILTKTLPVVPPTPPLQKKHISFAEHDTTYSTVGSPIEEEGNSSTSNITTDSSTSNLSLSKLNTPPKKQHLYPSHRHPIQKVESIQLLKKLTFSTDNWTLTEELKDGSKYYQLNSKIISDEEDEFINHHLDHRPSESSHLLKRKVPFIRADGVIEGGWTAEQLYSVIHCIGTRKLWDTSFQGGQIMERFSQKEYLVQWYLDSSLPIANVDLSAITSIESDPVNGTVYAATTSVIDQQVPPDESGHRIRAYSDLYGWVFRPQFDKHGRTSSVHVSFVYNLDFKYPIPNPILQSWMLDSLQSIQNVQKYLDQHGCPPYIRRVAGKVIQEDFDAATNHYQIIYIAKHQPSHSYRARKQQQNSSWCTDVKFHKNMFPHGLNIKVVPENMARIEVSPKNNKSIRIFTTDEAIDGKEVTFSLAPMVSTDDAVHHYTTYTYNGNLFVQHSHKPKAENAEQPHVEAVNNQLEKAEPAVDKMDKMQDKQEVASITLPTKAEIVPKKNNGGEEKETIPLNVPKGYILIPEHQNANILTLSDELSFNGQQISVIFFAMVICYYMGKFTSCSSC